VRGLDDLGVVDLEGLKDRHHHVDIETAAVLQTGDRLPVPADQFAAVADVEAGLWRSSTATLSIRRSLSTTISPSVSATSVRSSDLPEPVDVGRRGTGGRGPQPHRVRVAVAGPVVDLQPDQCSFHDGPFTFMVEPGRAVGEPRVQPVPRGSGAITGGLGACGNLGLGPGGRVGEGELAAVLGRTAHGVRGGGGAGSRRTRSERIRPNTWTGRSARTNANRVMSYDRPASYATGPPRSGRSSTRHTTRRDPAVALAPVPALGPPRS
jgi:hypothetical protein